MNLTEIASENYYKFLALFGIFLIIFSSTYYSNQIREIYLDIAKINKDTNLIKCNIDDFKKRIEILKKSHEYLHTMTGGFEKLSNNFKKLSQRFQDVLKKSSALITLNSDMAKYEERRGILEERILDSEKKLNESFIEWEYNRKVIEIKKRELDLWEVYTIVWGLLGIVLTIYGIKKWKKSQDIQDEIISIKLLLLKREHPTLVKKNEKFKNKSKILKHP